MSVGASGAVAGGRPLLIVTGLFSEARIAAGPGMTVICSSSDPDQLRAQLEAFDHTSVRGIISFGIAGGLDPMLRAGDLVVASEIMTSSGRWATAPSLSQNLVDGTSIGRRRIVGGTIVGAEEVILHPRDKTELHERTGATAVDMESHIAADFAHAAGLPFAALRVVSDPAHRALPELATSAIKPNGDVDLRKVMRGIARNPMVIRALVSTGRDFNRALRSLRDCRSFMLGSTSLVAAEG